MNVAFSWAVGALATLADLLAQYDYTEAAKEVRQMRDRLIDMQAAFKRGSSRR